MIATAGYDDNQQCNEGGFRSEGRHHGGAQ
jgi:hypothetical protein